MICVSIKDFEFEDCQRSVRRCERLLREAPDTIAEIRLDLCEMMTDRQVRQLFLESKIPLVAICRKKTLSLAMAAVESGAGYVDIDTLSSDAFFKEAHSILRNKKVKKIFSYHNYTDTPRTEEMVKIYKRAVSKGADIVKITTTACSIEDSERILSLYSLLRKGELTPAVPLIAFAMGETGRYSRLEALKSGSPIMYCSLREESKFTVGQFSFLQMRKFLEDSAISGEIAIPTSKSVAQRAIIAAGLAEGESEFKNFSSCRDIDAALGVARQVGARVEIDGDRLTIRGKGFSSLKKKAKKVSAPIVSAIMLPDTLNLFVGESGLLSRLCIPIAAQLGEGVTISGEGSLMGREMYGCKETLEQFGAKCLLTAEETLPAIVSGPLRGGKVIISGKKGSQLISGLLMALPLSTKDSELTIINATSVPYIRLTLDVLKSFGIVVTEREENGNMVFSIPGKQNYHVSDLILEGDWSSAANFVVMGSLFGDLTLKGLEMDSYQADRAIVDIVNGCGGEVYADGKKVYIKRSHLRPFKYDATDSPDLFPILAVMAALCDGESEIHGVSRLYNKECNRTEAICTVFEKMGVLIELDEDTMIINGMSPSRRIVEKKLLKGGSFSSFNDHRMAMALKIASLCATDKVSIDQVECIDKSFPTFMSIFKTLTFKKG